MGRGLLCHSISRVRACVPSKTVCTVAVVTAAAGVLLSKFSRGGAKLRSAYISLRGIE